MTQDIRWVGLGLAITILIVDLLTKSFMADMLTNTGGMLDILPFLDFRLGYNRGVSFGLLSSQNLWMPWVLAFFAFAVSVYLMSRLRRSETKIDAIWIGLIIGGALGNGIDRLLDGVVTDFIDVHGFGYHWPTFNLADVVIVLGVAIVLIQNVRTARL
jgi:signal peptidase II